MPPNLSMDTSELPSYQFPPGFRFHPSDEELIVHYLRNKVFSGPVPASVVAEVDLYKYNPWELPRKALFGEEEWYFFSPRDRKYPNGERPNRSAGGGYWKATGVDKPILTSSGTKSIAVKKSLVFYKGKPPKGTKTQWIMNEYRLLDTNIRPSRSKDSMRLDEWVLCRVRQKGSISKFTHEVQDIPMKESTVFFLPEVDQEAQPTNALNTDMITDCLKKDCRVLASILAGHTPLPSIETMSHSSFQRANMGTRVITTSSVYGESKEKANSSPATVSSFKNYNPLKRKHGGDEEDGYDNDQSGGISIGEHLLPSEMWSQHEANCCEYRQNGSQDLSDPMIGLLEHNELAFNENYIINF